MSSLLGGCNSKPTQKWWQICSTKIHTLVKVQTRVHTWSKSVKNCKRNLWKLPKVNRFWFFQRLLAKLSEEPKKLETFKKDRSTLHFPIIKGLLKIESVKVQHCARVERKLWSAFNCLRMGQRKPNVKRPSNFIKFRMTLNVLTLSCGHNKYTLFLVLGINV